MAGAPYEGLLGWRLGALDSKFSGLIERSRREEFIDEGEQRILNAARDSRNLVHAGRFARPGITRTAAMDMQAVMDHLIRKLARG